MATITDDIRKTATDTGYAVVGITDLAVQRVRTAQAKAVHARESFHADAARAKVEAELKRAQSTVVTLPGTAVSSALEAAGKVEEGLDGLTSRGRTVVTRIRRQKATQDLVQQGRTTLSRSKAAVTTVRRGAGDTQSAAKATATTARREATEARAAARTSTAGTKSAAKRTATTTRKRAAASRTATRSAATSARKSAAAAAKATAAAASKIGD